MTAGKNSHDLNAIKRIRHSQYLFVLIYAGLGAFLAASLFGSCSTQDVHPANLFFGEPYKYYILQGRGGGEWQLAGLAGNLAIMMAALLPCAFLRTPNRLRVAIYLFVWMIAVASITALSALRREGYGVSHQGAEQMEASNLQTVFHLP